MYYVWAVAGAAGLVLQVLVIAALFKGAWRQYKVMFCYCVTLLVTTAVEATAFYSRDSSARVAGYYWVFDSVRQALLYLVVISLIHGASERSARRSTIRRLLIAGAVVIAAASLYFTHEGGFGLWMTSFSRNLGFLAVILNLLLWAALIQSSRSDRTLLLISGGMGIQMAGKAIGHSLRHLAANLTTTGNVVLVLSHLLCLYVWWRAFSAPGTGAAERRLTIT
jgi:hypothetical protein